MRKIHRIAAGLATLASLLPQIATAAVTPPATSTTVVVTPSNMQGWSLAVETGTAAGQMVPGPSTPPPATQLSNRQNIILTPDYGFQ